ncbi:MAG: phosphoribosyl-ATP diphosphatase [Magnetococcus sp. WYHC-3]
MTPPRSPPAGDILAALHEVLLARRDADPDSSYVARLYARGTDRILQKVGEEAVETLLAAKSDNDDALIAELADLWFHTLVLLAHRGLHPDRVLNELARRFGVGGLEEKAARSPLSSG